MLDFSKIHADHITMLRERAGSKQEKSLPPSVPNTDDERYLRMVGELGKEKTLKTIERVKDYYRKKFNTTR